MAIIELVRGETVTREADRARRVAASKKAEAPAAEAAEDTAAEAAEEKTEAPEAEATADEKADDKA